MGEKTEDKKPALVESEGATVADDVTFTMGDGNFEEALESEKTFNNGDDPAVSEADDGDNESDPTDDEVPADKDQADGDENSDKPDPLTDEDTKAEDLPDLGEYDPKNKKAFDERYTTNTGLLNMEALEAEVLKNIEKGGDGAEPTLNENTLRYLELTRGISKEDANFFIQARMQESQKTWDGFVAGVGGIETINAAQAWAKENYTDAQKKNFDALLKSRSKDAQEKLTNEIELMIARWQRAGGKLEATPSAEKPQKPKNYAQRGETGSKSKPSEGPTVEPYASEAEQRKAGAGLYKINDDAKRKAATALHFARMQATREANKK